jgi:hypothetical protein
VQRYYPDPKWTNARNHKSRAENAGINIFQLTVKKNPVYMIGRVFYGFSGRTLERITRFKGVSGEKGALQTTELCSLHGKLYQKLNKPCQVRKDKLL